MAVHNLKAAWSVIFVYLCFALYSASAKEFEEEFGQNFAPENWQETAGLDKETEKRQDDMFEDEGDDMEKRGSKTDRLRGLRRLSRLYGQLDFDNLRPVKKTPETAGAMYHLEDKRDVSPHAWYGTGMWGKRSDNARGRWRTRSPRPQAFSNSMGLFGKRSGDAITKADVERLIDALFTDEEQRR